ncbi:MAG TPA: ATP-binding protein [Rhodoferax sp.]|nr:ATP-binding protein [Rhodoferax sp.]
MSADATLYPEGSGRHFLAASASVVVARVNASGTLLATNQHAVNLIGEPLVGKPWHTMLLNFGGPPVLQEWLAKPARPRLLNIKTAAGLPQTLEVTVEPDGADYLLFGEVNATEQARLSREVLQLNHELNNMSRELALKNDDLVKTQSQLVQSEKLASIGLLAGGVAHEINNPLAVVKSNLGQLRQYVKTLLTVIRASDAIEADASGSSSALAALQSLKQESDLPFIKNDVVFLLAECDESVDRVEKIVRGLRDFSRMDVRETLAFEDIHQALESTLTTIGPELTTRCEIRKEYGDIVPVQCMRGEICQVFMSLLVNAMKAMKDPGVITICTGQEKSEARIEISDTGHGIAQTDLPLIFDPFFTTRPVGQGTGLGLAVAYAIVQRHHGRIEVASALGAGTTFRVWLPIVQPVEVAPTQ